MKIAALLVLSRGGLTSDILLYNAFQILQKEKKSYICVSEEFLFIKTSNKSLKSPANAFKDLKFNLQLTPIAVLIVIPQIFLHQQTKKGLQGSVIRLVAFKYAFVLPLLCCTSDLQNLSPNFYSQINYYLRDLLNQNTPAN